MKRNIILTTLFSIIILCISCEKFLDVHPKSSISEDELLTSEIGFTQALTGIYSQLASRQLYGDNLTMGFASALGQNYATTAGTAFKFNATTALNYNTSEVITYKEEIWKTGYKAIAGLNNILANIDQNKSIFLDKNYELTKGEALGLRAYIHFDLLRLFAPTYSNAKDALAIPYRKDINAKSQKPATVAECINFIIDDLKQAEDLLLGADPILTGNKYRKYNMNYLAVKALEARVLLFQGNKTAAAAAVQKVIDTDILKFVTNAQVSTSTAGIKDRLFSTEQIFSLRVLKMINWVESSGSAYFKFTVNNSPNQLTLTDANFNTLFETTTGGSTDYRYRYLTELNGGVRYTSKYWQTWSLVNFTEQDRMDQTVPLLRLSELYYILAECANSQTEALAAINKVRTNRGLAQIVTPATTYEDEIKKEYQKEFYAEGQLFFYYKRKNATTMLFRTGTVTANNYIIPVPDSETEFNPQYN